MVEAIARNEGLPPKRKKKEKKEVASKQTEP